MADSRDILEFDETGTIVVGCKDKNVTEIVIPEGVKKIEPGVFASFTNLTSIEIPNSVTEIGWSAFFFCTGLTSIHIPNSVIKIEDWAFSGCLALTSVSIPNSVKSIGDYVFCDCKAFPIIDNIRYADTYLMEVVDKTCTSAVIKTGTRWIGAEAFKGCTGLISIEIPNSVTSIEYQAFSDCEKLTTIEIPNSVTEIGWRAFEGCTGLTSIHIPNSVIKIGDSAFSGCLALTSVSIPNSVTEIGWRTFDGCIGLTSVDIPNSVKIIQDGPFAKCKGLVDINVEFDNPNYISEVGVLYSKDKKVLIQFPCGRKGEYIVEAETERIGCAAFDGSELNIVSLGSKIKEIESYAFFNAALTELHIRHKCPEELNIGIVAFEGLENCTLYVPIGTGYAYRHHPAFEGKFKEVVIER